MSQHSKRTCARCAKPLADADNSTACPACWTRLERDLGDIPALVADLETTLARQTAAGQRSGPRSSETPLPYSVAASDAMRLLHSTLWPWVREGLEAHPTTPLPAPSTVGLAVAMLNLHGWLITQDDGYVAIDEIGYACSQARHAIDRAPDQTYAGRCDSRDATTMVECGTELYALDGQATVVCPVCSWERDVQAWRYAQLEAAADQLLTLSDMTRAIGETGSETVSRKRIEGWVRRGRLIRAGNVGAVATYRVGDVLDILNAEQQRAG